MKKFDPKEKCVACGGEECTFNFRNKFTDEGDDRYDDSYIFATCNRCNYRWQVLPLYRVDRTGKEKRIKIPKEKDNEPTG